MQEKFIDVERLIAQKNPKLLKWMPGFIIRYLKKTLHQNQINEFIATHPNHYNEDFCQAVLEFFDIKVNIEGVENIPSNGGCVIAANHPFGGMDAIALVPSIHERRPDIKFIVNDILLNLEGLKGMFVGVDKHAKNSRKSLKLVDDLFASDQLVCVFPAGLVSRKIKGQIRDLEWKKTFVTRARKHNRPIVPVYIDGRLSNWFYNLSNTRKFFGIKANIEMLYLADELFRQYGNELNIVIGKPIDLNESFTDLSDADAAKQIKELVYSQNQT